MPIYHFTEYPGNDQMDSIALTHGSSIYMEHPSKPPVIVTTTEEMNTFKTEGYRVKGVINLSDWLGTTSLPDEPNN